MFTEYQLYDVNKVTDKNNKEFRPSKGPMFKSYQVSVIGNKLMVFPEQSDVSSMGMITSNIEDIIVVKQGSYLVRTKNSTYSVKEVKND